MATRLQRIKNRLWERQQPSIHVAIVNRKIDAVLAELKRRGRVTDEMSCEQWQRARDRNPALVIREHHLYQHRWAARQQLYRKLERAERVAAQKARAAAKAQRADRAAAKKAEG